MSNDKKTLFFNHLKTKIMKTMNFMKSSMLMMMFLVSMSMYGSNDKKHSSHSDGVTVVYHGNSHSHGCDKHDYDQKKDKKHYKFDKYCKCNCHKCHHKHHHKGVKKHNHKTHAVSYVRYGRR